jgi:alpha-glucosidase
MGAINLRYDLIHYIYTSFWQMTKTAVPIIRPMWYEFPDDTELYEISSQFMFGDSILFAPKISKPTKYELSE